MAGHDFSAFQMWGGHKNKLIEENAFFFEQAMKRLLAQFTDQDMEQDAKRFADETYEKMGQYFNPDIHDEGSFAEDAWSAGTEFYQLLVEMRDDVRLGLVATMFHNWEKELRDWLSHEVRHWNRSELLKRSIWEATLDELFNLLKNIGFNVRGQGYFPQLDACRLVVNVFKHGDGKSLDALDKKYPQFTAKAQGSIFAANLNIRLIDYKHVEITDLDFKEFSEAIGSFWRDMPDNVMASEVNKIPKWFRDAIKNSKKVV
jgi:hypothetical protein